MAKTYVYISSWNEFVGTPGIGLLEFDPATGALTKLADLEQDLTCNCTVLDRERNILYITNEVKFHPDIKYVKGGGGLIYAFRIDPATGGLTQISRVDACCPCPAYLSIDPTGKFLVCANHSSYNAVTKAVQREDGTWGWEMEYDDATVDLFELNGDGTIGALVDVSKHVCRKEVFMLHSHPHSAVWNPAGTFFACCDKGDDKIYMYRIDYENKKLVPTCAPYQDQPFSGPRYCAFHPTKPWFYANHESKMFVSAFTYNDAGELTPINSVDTIPAEFPLPEVKGFLPGQKPGQQAFVMSPDGRYIYNVVNGNGADAVAVFEIDQETGALSEIQYLPVEGKWARGFALSPDGKFAVVSCLDDDGAVLSFSVGEDGRLTPTGSRASVPGGSFVTFYEAD